MGDNAGRRGRRWQRLRQNLKASRRPCCICGQPIDYNLTWPDPDSFSVQHLKAWHTHPESREDPANLDAAHLGCNSSEGNGGPKPGIGATSEAW